tara:strand:- start:8734 stop:9222 length:489 start_codon:yes stop_codon:yes gene_type:complete
MKHEPKKFDPKKGLNDQKRVDPKTFTAGINDEEGADITFKPSAEFVGSSPESSEMSPEEKRAEDLAIQDESDSPKRRKLAGIFSNLGEKGRPERLRKRARRREKFQINQPRIKSLSNILSPPKKENQTQGTAGTRYSPEGGAIDRSFENLINAITMRRGSRS